jgi:hypothetical protein
MAMIDCSECENPISDKAPSCPHCGIVFNAKPNVLDSIQTFKDSSTEKYFKGVMARKQLIKDILASIVISPILAFGIVVPLVVLICVVQLASGHEPNWDGYMPGLYFFCIPIAIGVFFYKTESWKSMKEKPEDFH